MQQGLHGENPVGHVVVVGVLSQSILLILSKGLDYTAGGMDTLEVLWDSLELGESKGCHYLKALCGACPQARLAFCAFRKCLQSLIAPISLLRQRGDENKELETMFSNGCWLLFIIL